MDNALEALKGLVDELSTTTKTTEKKEIIERHFAADEKYEGTLRALVALVLNPFKMFYVTSDKVLKHPELKNSAGTLHSNTISLLSDLNSRKLSGHAAIIAINAFLNSQPEEYKDTILNCIDKDLKCRTGVSLINKVHPGLIPEFDVALCNKYKDRKAKVDFTKQRWYASQKRDGCVSGDTLVDIEGVGKMPIRDVVEGNLEGRVLSFNHKTNKAEYCSITGWSKNGSLADPERDSLWYELEDDKGNKIKVTGNHLVFLPRLKAYRRADQLVEGDIIQLND